MQIFLGADHRGYELKERIKSDLERRGYEVFDVGADEYDKDDDYVDFGVAVAKRVQEEKGSVGILLAVLGIYESLMFFFLVLSALLPPIGGIYVADHAALSGF